MMKIVNAPLPSSLETSIEKDRDDRSAIPEATLALDSLSGGSGVFEESGGEWEYRSDGVLAKHRILLPPFVRACYYAPFQKYAINPALDLWPEGYNQCHPLVITDFRHVKRGGMFAILHLEDGGYLALLPITSSHLMNWMKGDETGLLLESGHWGTSGYSGAALLLAWGSDRNPYTACELAWKVAASRPGVSESLKLRADKTYPEMLEYLGWCSWEEFKCDISSDLLVQMIGDLESGGVPVRWLLVDDGHLDIRETSATSNTQEGMNAIVGGRLASFGANASRFPHGWSPLLARAQQSRIRWMGVWLNFNGYWGGIDTDNTLPDSVRSLLMQVNPGQMVTRDAPAAAAAFYEALVQQQQRAGFNFIKVDNQANNVTFYRNKVPNAVAAASNNHKGLEQAVEKHLEGMINCMAHNNICSMHTAFSQVTRCSEDYKKGDLWRAKHHLNNSYHNMLWLGQTVWGDHDMFHSSDEFALLFANSKAISGGPIYLSDLPSHIDAALVKRLCFEDGRLLRPLAPALPSPESIFCNTYESGEAYVVMAPLPNRCAAFIGYNLTHPEKPVTGTIQARDYCFTPGMMQDGVAAWTFPPEGVLAYQPREGSAHRLGPEERLSFQLPAFGDAVYFLIPIVNGWAVIGRSDKIMSPCAVSELSASSWQLQLQLLEQGSLLIWCAEGQPRLETFGPMEALGNGLWRADLPVVPGPVDLIIRR